MFAKADPDGDDNWTGHTRHTVEIAAQNLVFRGVVTAMDLCASAVYRLAGGTLRPNFEFDVGQWFDRRANPPWAKTPAPLAAWVRLFDSDSDTDGDWKLATWLRDAYTHRTTTRHFTLSLGRPSVAQTSLDADGVLHASTATMNRIVSFGLARFRSFADAVDQV
jgi:hypothetical protein